MKNICHHDVSLMDDCSVTNSIYNCYKDLSEKYTQLFQNISACVRELEDSLM